MKWYRNLRETPGKNMSDWRALERSEKTIDKHEKEIGELKKLILLQKTKKGSKNNA